jgi:hypothetical protein
MVGLVIVEFVASFKGSGSPALHHVILHSPFPDFTSKPLLKFCDYHFQDLLCIFGRILWVLCDTLPDLSVSWFT